MLKISKVFNAIGFCLFYVKEVILSNLRVAKDVLSPKPNIHPGIFILPLDPGLTDQQKLFLSNLITMTPGTLSMDLDPNENILIIHTIYLGEGADRTREELKNVYERKVRNAF